MPKPLFGDNGSGMHAHQSSVEGRQAALRRQRVRRPERDGAVLHRRPAQARARPAAPSRNPTTNCYKRLVPGYEAPVNLAYSRAQPLGRHPHPDVLARARRPSASSSARPIRPCNPYLAFAAMLMAGLDGIQNKIDPGEPLDKNIYDLPPEELANVGRCRRAWRRRSTRWRPTTSSCSRATCSRGRDRELDRLQAQRGGRPAPAAASLRVPPLLRLLKNT